jgi:hypothetical protein
VSVDSRQSAKDWAGNLWAYALAWGWPPFALIAGSLVDAPARTAIWSIALIWMGSACLMNARRCGRTHCHFTGPYYLALVIPVVLHGLGLFPLGPLAWWVLGGAILIGGKIIWWTTEAVLGRYRTGT